MGTTEMRSQTGAPAAAQNSRDGAKSPPRRLGRGLSSLLHAPVAVDIPPSVPAAPVPPPAHQPASPAPTGEQAVAGARSSDLSSADQPGRAFRAVRVDSITTSPHQPREAIDESALRGLADSIRTSGLMQPIAVRPIGSGGGEARFELIAGERRWRAATLAGLETVPALVVDLDDQSAAEWALVENVQREDLNAIERGRALRRLADTFGLPQSALAERLGLDRSTIANLMRLPDLEPEIQAMLRDGRLAAGHGKALLGAPAGRARLTLAERCAQAGWSVRRLEAAVKGLDAESGATRSGEVKAPDAAAAQRHANTRDIEKQLSDHLGTRVRLATDGAGRKGRIVIEFYDLDHFDGLLERIGFRAQ